MKTSMVLLIGLVGGLCLVGLLVLIYVNYMAKPRSVIDMFYGFLFFLWIYYFSEFLSAWVKALKRVGKEDDQRA